MDILCHSVTFFSMAPSFACQKHPLSFSLFCDHKGVSNWLSSIHLEVYIPRFEWYFIDGMDLLEITERDLLLLEIPPKDRVYLIGQINLLRVQYGHEISKFQTNNAQFC
jgi:hypothetical protein